MILPQDMHVLQCATFAHGTILQTVYWLTFIQNIESFAKDGDIDLPGTTRMQLEGSC